ncbi:DUF4962 domain-containing protein [Paenibacillus protaetiae]|uniref:DUF4962 domain-containing protein n=1 Tax=Paenibacillus protaetiae TaxID=2509456 RepID=A0A4P6EY04_9BACL|nr:DUF4962 domain-containing protein [Paenibacillus protaetiae]QAY65507.1 DUF4962 domain-containing protein [Paenibacillus protaetiae]
MIALSEPQSGKMSVPYAPDEHTALLENPPRFTWMPAVQEKGYYVLQYSTSESFEQLKTVTVQGIPYNLYTPSTVLEPGRYYWRYALAADPAEGGGQSGWSKVRAFTVPEGLPETPLPGRAERYLGTNTAHPRLWLNAQQIADFQAELAKDPAYCGWDRFYAQSVKRWMDAALIPEPERYPNDKRVARLWRQMYMDCQEALYAVRHLSVAGIMTENAAMIARAKEWLLHVAGWDTEGATAHHYNDEAAFRVAGALAWGYDWLYPHLSEQERAEVRAVLLRRTGQVADYAMNRVKIHHVPYDSHPIRSLSSVLVPSGIVLLHEDPQAAEWLDYTLEYYACLYSPWGGEDGGWAEGPQYWTTGLAFVLDAMNLIRGYTGIQLLERPFFTKTGDFPLYCAAPGTVRASFGDQSNLGEPVSLKTGFNIRQFAGLTGNGLYQWYYEQTAESDKDADTKFYNYGWWDFRFDEMMYRHDYPDVAAVPPVNGAIEPVKWFRDIGWVAMHSRMDDPEKHIMLLAKSSRYGSISHSHGDQNGFLLHAYGEPLAIESGHYVSYGSTMHMNWRRQTLSTNNIIVDGLGQYAGKDKALCMEATGIVEDARYLPDNGGCGYARMDAANAYLSHVPYLQRYTREFYFIGDSYIVIADAVDLSQPAKLDWLMHTLYPMELDGQTFHVNGVKADMTGTFVYSSSGELALSQHNRFTGVDPAELDGLDNQWHLHAQTAAAARHRLVTLLVPSRKGTAKQVSYRMTERGEGVAISFRDAASGASREIEVL